MSFMHHSYAKYLDSLASEQKCACGQRPLGRCAACSDRQPQQEELPIAETEQLVFSFATTTSNVYPEGF